MSKLPPDLESAFSQLTLVPDLFDEVKKKRGVLPKKSQRGRKFDVPILRYVCWHEYVTLHQLVYRFFVYDGKGPRYGFRVVQELIERGLIRSEPLDPDKGSISRQVLSATDAGWEYIGKKPRKGRRPNDLIALRDYRLQFAEMILEREATGWRLVKGKKRGFELLRRAALAEYRKKTLTDMERLFQRRVREAASVPMRVSALEHPASGAVRLILAVRRWSSYKKEIQALPDLALFHTIVFEMVSADPVLEERARAYLKRWAAKRKINYEVVSVPHFRLREHPSAAAVPEVSRYVAHQVTSPRSLI
jgi:hypothetical protein